MRFKGLDLNLLVALDALLTARNLTAAARTIHLSQPAMSAAVARLRKYFGDELFMMNGRQLVPTQLGEGLANPVREALAHIQMTIALRDTFDPRTSGRCFRIVLSDFITIILISRVVERVRDIAPKVTFEFLPFDDQPDQPLHRGEVDFLIFPEIYMANAHPHVALFEESMVCVACRSNREITGNLTFAKYMAMGHIGAQFGRSRKPAIEEWLLPEHGLKRRVEVAVQSFSMIPHFVAGSNRIATMHARLADHYARIMPLQILPLPVQLPRITEALQWPALYHQDPANIWLRGIVQAEAMRLQTTADG